MQRLIPKPPGNRVLLRAYKDSVPRPDQPADLMIQPNASGSWFSFTGAGDFQNDPVHRLNENSFGIEPAPWVYKRLELFTEQGDAYVLVLPTIANNDDNDDILEIARDTDFATPRTCLRLKCHFQTFLTKAHATIGFELRLRRAATGQHAVEIAFLRIGDANETRGKSFSALSSLLDGGYEESGAVASLFVQYMNAANSNGRDKFSEPWSNFGNRKTHVPITCDRSVFADDGQTVLPTFAITDGRSHILRHQTPEGNSVADAQLGGLELVGGCSVESLRQRASVEWLRRYEGSGEKPWDISGLFAVGPFWNAVRLRYLNQLAGVRPTNRLSFLPTLTDGESYDDEAIQVKRPLLLTMAVGQDSEASANLSVPRLRLRFKSIQLMNPARVAASFDLGNSTLTFDSSTVEALPKLAAEFRMSLALKATAVDVDPAIASRIGALDLTFSRKVSDLRQNGRSPLSSRLELLTVAEVATTPRLRSTLLLPVASVDAGGQDGLPASEFTPDGYAYFRNDAREECLMEERFRGSAPVVFPDPKAREKAIAAAKNAYWVEIRESNPPDFSQTVSIDLHAVKTAQEKQRVFVFDSNPFLVAEVDFDGLKRKATSPTDIVARWNTGGREGAGWQLFTDAEPLTLTLPPQGIGEEMPRDTEMAGEKNKPFEFRFSPVARETLEGSYTPQNFTEAPWNLRRLLGFPGQRDAGAGVVQLQYELLYGLSCVADTKMLRLAELFATVGAIPGRLSFKPESGPAYADFRKRWSEFVELYNSRVAMLEPRQSGANYGRTAGARGAAALPQVLTLTDGVSCSFRDAKLSRPGRPKLVDEDEDAFPPAPDGGLRGGATWGFESARVYHATLRNPDSTSALLSRPYFSSVGGSGYQKASFDRGLTSVYADTAIGRTFFYSIERLGRIGVYGNLARHVIEYGRSVEHSAQFDQPDFGGRAVLRKLREYVQILEPKLALSPGTSATPEAGCVRSIEFKCDTIPVTSAWGANVGSSGWKLPLWVRGAEKDAAGAATAYSVPEVVFNMAGAEGADVECVILEPEKLMFYTQTTLSDPLADADPHAWPLVEGVDFSAMPVTLPNPAFPGNDLQQPDSYDASHPLGLGAFTLAIAEGQGRVNLVHGRAEEAMGALLHSVTMQRLSGVALLSLPVTGIADLRGGLSEASDMVREELFKQCRSLVPAKIDGTSLDSALAKIAAMLPKVDANSILVEEKRIHDRWKAVLTSELAQVDSLLGSVLTSVSLASMDATKARKALGDAVDHTVAELGVRLAAVAVTPAPMARLAKDALRAFGLALADLQSKQAVVLAPLPTEHIEQTVMQRLAPVREVLNQLRHSLGCRREPWMPAFAALADAADTAIGELSKALAERRDATASYQAMLKTVDLSVQTSVKDALDKLAAAADAYQAELDTKLMATRDRLKAAIRNLSDSVLLATDAANVKKRVDALTGAAKAEAAALLKSVADLKLASQLNSQVQELLAQVPNPQKLVTDAMTRLAGIGLDPDVRKWQRQCESARRDVEHALDRYTGNALGQMPALFKNLPRANAVPVLLQRAFGASPKIPNLDFSIPQGVAYYFHEGTKELGLTPLLTRVQGLGEKLAPLATELPSFKLLDRVIPSLNLEYFDVSKILPKFAGLDLKNLFPGLKMPEGAGDHIKLRQGFDKSANRAWVQADIAIQSSGPATLFSVGPLALQLPSASLTATVRMESDTQGHVVRSTYGAVTGDWNLVIGGTTIITLEESSLTFNTEGKLHFNVSPARVKLAAIFAILEQAVRKFSEPGSGFSYLLSAKGIETQLSLPIPNFSAGTSGITNLSFSFLFGIEWFPEFAINAGFGLARRDAPFNLSIFILGGGGYLEARARYVPGKALSCSVDISLAASAALAISLGPISGGVSVFLGTEIHYQSGGQGSELRVGIYILITGQVSVLGIVSAYIGLRLEASYGNGQFIGRGTFTIRIKICWCFTLKVSQQVTMSLGKASTNTAALEYPRFGFRPDPTLGIASDASGYMPPPPDFAGAAQRYVNMIS